MKKLWITLLGIGALLYAPLVLAESTQGAQGPVIGQPALALMAKDTNGADVSLAAYNGKVVVLEWTNHECPFVKKQYDSKNMQDLQKYAHDQGVIWISLVSSAPDKQGHVDTVMANQIVKDQGATITHTILDPQGTIGRAYNARTTPHMFVIAPNGTVAYMGAIDSDSSLKTEGIKTATNYVRVAIDEIQAGKPVTTAQTEPYGCSVKY